MTALWAYWLQDVDPAQVAASPFSTVVVDPYDNDGQAFSPEQVAQMGGGAADGRLTLAYVSAGEAESYRDYWQPSWDSNPPSFLGKEDPDWAGDYYVRFWDSGWKDIMHHYLDGVVAQGFDGAWLDVIDVYYMAFQGERADPAKDMIDFVADLSAYAKAQNPNFQIYVNGAEELIAHPDHAAYLTAIDGIGKEEIYYGLNGRNTPNSAEDIKYTTDLLHTAQAAGKTILDQEYVTTPAAEADVVHHAQADGFSTYIAPLDLDKLDYTVPDLLGETGNPVPIPPSPPTPAPGGHLGDDLYVVTSPTTIIDEAVGAGHDTIQTSVTYTLKAGSSVETLETTNAHSTDALSLTGNEFDNAVVGNAGPNVLNGGAGNDVLTGKAGADQLLGGDGADTIAAGKGDDKLAGNAGSDVLTGGPGHDTFTFDTSFSPDKITDFRPNMDQIALDHALFTTFNSAGALSTEAFYQGAAAHDALDRVIYNNKTGDLVYDPDGNGPSAAITFGHVSPDLHLTSHDVVIV